MSKEKKTVELKEEDLEKVAGGSEELDYAVNYMLGHLSIAAGSTNDKEILDHIEQIKGCISDNDFNEAYRIATIAIDHFEDFQEWQRAIAHIIIVAEILRSKWGAN